MEGCRVGVWQGVYVRALFCRLLLYIYFYIQGFGVRAISYKDFDGYGVFRAMASSGSFRVIKDTFSTSLLLECFGRFPSFFGQVVNVSFASGSFPFNGPAIFHYIGGRLPFRDFGRVGFHIRALYVYRGLHSSV